MRQLARRTRRVLGDADQLQEFARAGLRLLIETVGADRCMYGAECPGVGSSVNPKTGKTFDDIVPVIKSFDWLSDGDKKMIFEDNARAFFRI